jgi:hypothetical protein
MFAGVVTSLEASSLETSFCSLAWSACFVRLLRLEMKFLSFAMCHGGCLLQVSSPALLLVTVGLLLAAASTARSIPRRLVFLGNLQCGAG